MVTIKDVAARANVSVTTVSIVLNGKAAERKISEATVDKIMNAVRQLNYQPNIAARKLRAFDNNKPNIALYIAYDHRSSMLSQFLKSIYKEKTNGPYDFSIIVCPFKSGALYKEANLQSTDSFSAAIISTLAPADVEYLKKNKPPFPVVLMNRSIDGMSSVCANIQKSIDELVGLLQKKGHKQIAAILMEDSYLAAKVRSRNFLSACYEKGITCSNEHIILTTDSISGGAEAAKKLLSAPNLPKMLFCDTDSIALGVLHTFNKANIKIPDDFEIVAIRLSNSERSEYSIPSLTVIDIFLEQNIINCLKLVLDYLHNKITEPVQKTYDTIILYRESFPLI